jgi:phenylalanyl-tRNA synthetase beta chain
VGEFGEIHPQVLTYFSFPEPVCAGELDCTASLMTDLASAD